MLAGWSAKQSKCVCVDGSAGTDRDELDRVAGAYPVDDSEMADAKAPETCQLVLQQLAGGGIRSNQIEPGSDLLFQIGMKAPDEVVDGCWNTETIGLHQM
jgi:hypothetical protein